MRIAVFGAGALGSLYGGLLSEDHDVTLVGRQEHIDAGQRALSWVDERVMRRLGVPLPDAPAAPPPPASSSELPICAPCRPCCMPSSRRGWMGISENPLAAPDLGPPSDLPHLRGPPA